MAKSTCYSLVAKAGDLFPLMFTGKLLTKSIIDDFKLKEQSCQAGLHNVENKKKMISVHLTRVSRISSYLSDVFINENIIIVFVFLFRALVSHD